MCAPELVWLVSFGLLPCCPFPDLRKIDSAMRKHELQSGSWRLCRSIGFAAVCLILSIGVVPNSLAIDPTRSPDSAARPAQDAALGTNPARPVGSRWTPARQTTGHLSNRELGLVINTADPYSVEVGNFYARARALREEQVLRIEVPLKPVLAPDEFAHLNAQVRAHFGPEIQALALAWTWPYSVSCNSITSALSIGYDDKLCSQTCAASAPSRYFNAATRRPFSDLGIRPSMMLAARSVDQAKALIARGVASDGALGLRGAPPVQAYFILTDDRARNVRAGIYPPAGLLKRAGIDVHVRAYRNGEVLRDALIYQTGSSQITNSRNIQWAPGALADHLTSAGGQLSEGGGQTTVLEWIESGAIASYGTVSEPCNHLQKFPHPQLLLQHYAQGGSALEAYWKSVAWPQQGIFVGEPLAAPFSRR
jgi:uncharacterized protein (TIGR03790 family)